jgi:hypothetical protein
MADIGLVRFAMIALHVGQAALPACHSKFSKRHLTQPQWLVVLCRMRDDGWTFRGADDCRAEHRESRTALGLRAVPDDTILSRCLRRLKETILEHVWKVVVQRWLP